MKLSVIIPVFNVAPYIEKCLQSLRISDHNDDIEVLIIDDCSTDNSVLLCEKYLSSNVKIVKKTSNTGLSDTRNIGIRRSSGDYVMFLDSDDYVEEDYYERIECLLNHFDFPDVIYFGYYQEKNNVTTPYFGFASPKNRLYKKNEFLESELGKRTLYAAACFGIYKRELLLNNHLYFKSGIFHEDELWTPQVICKADSIATSDYIYYHYVRRENSITTKKDKTQNGLDMLDVCAELESTLIIGDKNVKKLMNNHLAMLYMKGVSEGLLYKKNKKQIDRLYPIRHACKAQDIIKALIFVVSLKGYCFVNRVVKK